MTVPSILHRSRFALFGLALLSSMRAAGAEESYFPEALLSEQRPCADSPQDSGLALGRYSELLVDGISNELRVANEPILHSALDREAIRLLYGHSLVRGSTIIGVDDASSARPRLTVVDLDTTPSGDPAVRRRIERDLTPEEAEQLRAVLASSRPFDPPRAYCGWGLDGANWVIEGVQDGRYGVVQQWSPQDGPVYEVGALLLSLAGRDFLASR